MPPRRPSPKLPSLDWSVYILRCGDGSLYTGATNDLDRRLLRHQSGKGAAYTRSRLPVSLVFREPAQDRSSALSREAQLKRLTRAQKLALVGSAKTKTARSTRAKKSQALRSTRTTKPQAARSTRTKAL